MNFAVFCPYDAAYPGGVVSLTKELAGYFKQKGHSVDIIAPTSDPANGAGIISVGRPLKLVVQGGTISRVSVSIWNYGVIGELFRERDYDAVIIEEPAAPVLGIATMVIATKFPDLPLVTISHQNTPPTALIKSYAAIARALGLDQLIERADIRIAISEAARNSAATWFSPHDPSQYRLIPNAIDTGHFSETVLPQQTALDGRVNLLDGKINILASPARLDDKRKGLDTLLLGYVSAKYANPNLRLIITGRGDLPDYAREILHAVNPDGDKEIVLTGGVPYEDLPRYFQAADIFCLTPYTGEAFGRVLIEAMALGKPVIATNIEGYKEVVTEDVGILVPPKDEKAVAEALLKLAADSTLRAEMGSAGRKRVEQLYTWEVVGEKILQAIEEAIEVRKGNTAKANPLPSWLEWIIDRTIKAA